MTGTGARSDDERRALIRLREHLLAQRPTGFFARLGWRRQLRRLELLLDWEDTRRTPAETEATFYKRSLYSTLASLGFLAFYGLFFTHHAITLGRVTLMLGVCGAGAGAATVLLRRVARREARSFESLYERWLARAQALPPGDAPPPALPSRREEPAS